MNKCYKDYIIDAWNRGDKNIRESFNSNGTPKQVDFTDSITLEKKHRKKILQDKYYELCRINAIQLPQNSRVKDFTMWNYPENCSRKEYNKIWMHNNRIIKRIKEFKQLTN